MQMPVMDGLETTPLIRQGGRCRDTPIIATTANAFEHDLQACRDAGMDEHEAKPIDPEALFERILGLMRVRR